VSAFGSAEEDPPGEPFPLGVLVSQHGVVDSVPFSVRRPNQEPLYMRATDGRSMVQGIDGSSLEFTVPCDEGETADLLVWRGYDTLDVVGSPPSIEHRDHGAF
jgi:hypothetical protein